MEAYLFFLLLYSIGGFKLEILVSVLPLSVSGLCRNNRDG